MAFARFFLLPQTVALLLGGACLSFAGTSILPFPAPRRVMPEFRQVFDRVRHVTQVPVVLPTGSLGKFYCSIETLTPREYDINIDLTPGCHGTTPCSLGSISGMKSRSPTAYGTAVFPMDTGRDANFPKIPVTLVHHIKGYYAEARVGYPSFVY